MSFSEFYQRSINEPEQFWAEQARRIDWQTPLLTNRSSSGPSRPGVLTGRRPLRKRSITAIRRLPVGFVKAEPTCATTPSTAGWRNSQRRWR